MINKDDLEVQHRWNQLFPELPSDSLEGEDVYSIVVGYCLGMGLDIDHAHIVASDPKTEM